MNTAQCTTDDVMKTIAPALSFPAKPYLYCQKKILRFSRIAILEIPKIFRKCHLAALVPVYTFFPQISTKFSQSPWLYADFLYTNFRLPSCPLYCKVLPDKKIILSHPPLILRYTLVSRTYKIFCSGTINLVAHFLFFFWQNFKYVIVARQWWKMIKYYKVFRISDPTYVNRITFFPFFYHKKTDSIGVFIWT